MRAFISDDLLLQCSVKYDTGKDCSFNGSSIAGLCYKRLDAVIRINFEGA
jgi:hypothetical protein